MAGQLFMVSLTLAATAAGFVNHQFAILWWLLAAVFGIATVVGWLRRRRSDDPSRPTSHTISSTRGDQSPAINVVGSANTVNVGAAAPTTVPISPADELRLARSDLRNAIQAFADKDAFEKDPLRFQVHLFGDPTKEIRRIIGNHWASRLPEVDRALENSPSQPEYEWRLSALKRLAVLVDEILDPTTRGFQSAGRGLDASGGPAGGGGTFATPFAGRELTPDAGHRADVDLQHAVLRELRDLNRRQSQGSEILTLDVSGLAHGFGIPIERVHDVLSDMLALGLVEPHYPTWEQGPMEGALRITTAGMEALRSIEGD